MANNIGKILTAAVSTMWIVMSLMAFQSSVDLRYQPFPTTSETEIVHEETHNPNGYSWSHILPVEKIFQAHSSAGLRYYLLQKKQLRIFVTSIKSQNEKSEKFSDYNRMYMTGLVSLKKEPSRS